jgi:holo-[acyl-carrier protein] synthase
LRVGAPVAQGAREGAVAIAGLGVDLVELARVSSALERFGERFVGKLMDPPEAARRARALAEAVAAKEAASKALGTGWTRGVRWRDVVLEPGAAPGLRLLGRAAEVARRLGSDGSTLVELEWREGVAVGRVALLRP